VKKEVYIIIHGHFYQPPRENPWTGRIEKQSSAAPYHDWNELIAAQCYVPNGASRVLDAQQRIAATVNNYKHMSFNIGPTLFNWLERHEVSTYEHIINADIASRAANNGHGNAIAQSFNHTILPLSTSRDQRTQIEWGIRDFRRRFNRDPEGMWLPETAINNTTLENLYEKGIGFTILSPTQAARFRPLGLEDWISCKEIAIDTSRPYRVFLKDKSGKRDPDRWIDVFFFDWTVSVGVSFEHLLTNGDHFSEKITSVVPDRPGPIVITVATDGETFGHHEPFGDMCLAYFYKNSVHRQGFRITNFANYLEMFPPDLEAELSFGPNDEGSSWSCAHGAGRWQSDCGCTTGGPSWWNQKWRRPLRDSMNLLTTKLDSLFEKSGSRICDDIWAARNDYITLILEPGLPGVIDKFCKKHLKQPGDASLLLKLCQMQMFTQFSLTSCGWFFSEISGLEATQNLKYAARALELAELLGDTQTRPAFLDVLRKAVSNNPEAGTGKDLFEKAIRQSLFSEENMVSCFAITRLLADETATLKLDTFHFDVEEIRTDKIPDNYESLVGLIKIDNRDCLEKRLYAFFATKFTQRDVRCYLRQVDNVVEYESLIAKLRQIDKSQAAALFGSRYYSWSDMVPEAAEQMMQGMLSQSITQVHTEFEKLYLANRDLFQAYVRTGLELPGEIQPIVRFTLTRLFTREIILHRGNWTRDNFSHAASLLAEAENLTLSVDKKEVEKLANEDIASASESLRADGNRVTLENLVQILDICDMLKLTVRKHIAENAAMDYLTHIVVPAIEEAAAQNDTARKKALLEILHHIEQLNIAVGDYLHVLE